VVAAVDHDRHPQRLEPLEREADVEDALDAGGDHRHRGDGHLGEVGGDVEGGGRAAVHAADAPGGEHSDAGERGDAHGGRHGGGASGLRGDQPWQIAGGGLVHAVLGAQAFQLVGVEADAAHAVEHCDGGRCRAVGAHDAFHLGCHLHVLRVGHAMADDGALQRDHGMAGSEGFRDRGQDGKAVRCVHRAPQLKVCLNNLRHTNASASRMSSRPRKADSNDIRCVSSSATTSNIRS